MQKGSIRDGQLILIRPGKMMVYNRAQFLKRSKEMLWVASFFLLPLPPNASLVCVTVCETRCNNRGPPVSSQGDTQIKSQTASKLLKERAKKKKEPKKGQLDKVKQSYSSSDVFAHEHTRTLGRLDKTAKTNTLSLSRSQSQMSGSVSPRCDMSHGAYARNKAKSTNQRAESEDALYAWRSKRARCFFSGKGTTAPAFIDMGVTALTWCKHRQSKQAV